MRISWGLLPPDKDVYVIVLTDADTSSKIQVSDNRIINLRFIGFFLLPAE